MLVVKQAVKTFKAGDSKVTAVNDVSFRVEQGEFVAIVGRSGSGKTTLMSLLGALDTPSSGVVEVDGQDITKLHDHALIKYRGQKIGFVFQGYNLIPNLTALENVMLPMEGGSTARPEQKTRAESLLAQVGLSDDKQRRKPGRLSGGEQQRVAIARALANKPKLVLADEPTGNLDSHNSDIIVALLRDLSRSENTTIIIVTHDMALAKQADKVFHLQDGALIQAESK
jgi:putative ABC transport system ATP-binding protein